MLKNKIILKEKKLEEEKFKLIFDSVLDGILLVSIKTNKFFLANKAICRMLGYSKKEILNLGIKDIHPKNQLASILKIFKNQVKNKIQIAKNICVLKKDKSIFYADISSGIVLLGGQSYMIGIFRDITDRKEQEEKLKESQEKFFNVFENANDAIWLMSGNIFVDCNSRTVKMFNCKNKKDMVNHTPMDFSPKNQPDGQDSKKKALKYIKAAYGGKPQRFYWQHKTKDGILFDTEISLNRFFSNKEIYLRAMGKDISEIKKIQEKLEESEKKFHNIFKYSAVGVAIVRSDGLWLDVNDALSKITGYSKKELLEDKFNNITYPDDREKSLAFLNMLFSGKVKHIHFEKRYIHKKGHIVWVYLSSALVRDKDNIPLYTVTHIEDITKQKTEERKLIKAEAKYRRLFESSKDSILVLGMENGEILDSNPAVLDLFGYPAKELIGKKIFDIKEFKNILSKDKFLEFQKEGYVKYDNLIIKTKNGIEKNVEFVLNIYTVDYQKVIQCNIRDITDRIKKENELEQAKINFLALTSHQLRTPLSITKWVLETLAFDENITLRQKEKFHDLVISNERLINLVNNLLEVNKIEAGKMLVNKRPTNMKELIDNIILSFKTLAENKKKHIKIIMPKKLENINCDPVLIRGALENLLNNAINYSPEDSREIELKIINRKDDYLISVHNDGIIDEESGERIKIFEKFVRGKNGSEKQPSGSGLGLYIVKRIIEESGGAIWFKSNTESGTTFYFTIIKSNKL